MAEFNFNIAPSIFSVEVFDEVSTDCATILRYKVSASEGDLIRFDVGQSNINFAENIFYTIGGVKTVFDGSEQTITYGYDLFISFSISNSGKSGFFRDVVINVHNDTVVNSFNHYQNTSIRINDNAVCDSGKVDIYDNDIFLNSDMYGSTGLNMQNNNTQQELNIKLSNMLQTAFVNISTDINLSNPSENLRTIFYNDSDNDIVITIDKEFFTYNGQEIIIIQEGSGTITIAEGNGISIKYNLSGESKTIGKGDRAGIMRVQESIAVFV